MTNREVVIFSDDANQTEEVQEIVQDEVNAADEQEDYSNIIDCQSVADCNDMAIKLKEEFGDIISDITYIDIFNLAGKQIGYYLDYIFNDHQYLDTETCAKNGENLISELSKRNIDYVCDETGLLKVGAAK